MEKQRYIEAGRIVGAHGVRGEVKTEVWLDSPGFMRRYKTLYIDGQGRRVLSARAHKSFLIVHLEGVEDADAAMRLKDRKVYVDRREVELPRGAFFLCDIIGAQVRDENGRDVGVLEDVLETPASRVYVVRGETEHLIPAVPEFIISTDADAGLVTVRLIEGM